MAVVQSQKSEKEKLDTLQLLTNLPKLHEAYLTVTLTMKYDTVALTFECDPTPSPSPCG